MGIITEYIAEPCKKQGYSDTETTKAFEERIKELLRNTLRQRSLWNAPPEWICPPRCNYKDYASWNEPEAMEELYRDFYTEKILGKLHLYCPMIAEGRSLDGFVVTTLRNFIHDLHRSADPKGSNAFDNITKIVKSLLDDEKLFTATPDADIKKESKSFHFSREHEAKKTISHGELEEATRYCASYGAMMREIGKSKSVKSPALLGKFLFELFDQFNESVRINLGELINLVQSELRHQNQTISIDEEEEKGKQFPIDGTDSPIMQILKKESPERLRALVDCVIAKIDSGHYQDKRKKTLKLYWRWIVNRGLADEEMGNIVKDFTQIIGKSDSTVSSDKKELEKLALACKNRTEE